MHEALQAHAALEWEAIFGDEVPCAAARRIEDMELYLYQCAF